MRNLLWVGFFLALFYPLRGLAESDGLSAKSSLISYTFTGAVEGAGTATGLTLEWSRYIKNSWSVVVGWRSARDADGVRDRYSATFMGARFFLNNTGVPIYSNNKASIISYTFDYMPYVETSLSAGRYLLRTLDELGSAELSSDFYGAFASFGMLWLMGESWAVDLSMGGENAVGAGGAQLAAFTTFVHIGGIIYL